MGKRAVQSIEGILAPGRPGRIPKRTAGEKSDDGRVGDGLTNGRPRIYAGAYLVLERTPEKNLVLAAIQMPKWLVSHKKKKKILQ